MAVIKLFQELTQAYGAKVNEVLKNMDNGLAHQPIYCECIAEVIKCHEKISTRLKIPKEYLIGFERHAENARKNILERTWKRTVSGNYHSNFLISRNCLNLYYGRLEIGQHC